MSSLNKIRLPDGTMLNVAEWLHWPLYSAIEINDTGAIRLDAFSYTRGQTVAGSQNVSTGSRNASEADTNLLRKKRMGQDEAIVVMAITYEVFAITSASGSSQSPEVSGLGTPIVESGNLRRLQRDAMCELLVGAHIKKPQVQVPFSYIPQSIGAPITVSGTREDFDAGSGGPISPRAQRQFMLPVYIGGYGESAKPGNSMHFKLRFRTPGGAPDDFDQEVKIRFWLDGLKKRPG